MSVKSMGKEGLLSIVMVNYNHGLCLRESLDSIIAQRYENWELIIIDDGSRDGSLEIINGYLARFPERFRLYTHSNKANLGIAASYELGLSLCRGEYVGFLEPDDIWKPENAGEKISALVSEEVVLAYSGVDTLGDPLIIRNKQPYFMSCFHMPINNPFTAFPSILVFNFIPTFSTVIVRSSVLNGIKFIPDSKFAMWLDWFIWAQVSLRGKFLFIPKKLVNWRIYGDSYYGKFVLQTGFIKLLLFEIRYRMMLYRELILLKKPDALVRSKVLYFLFIAGFARKVRLAFDRGRIYLWILLAILYA